MGIDFGGFVIGDGLKRLEVGGTMGEEVVEGGHSGLLVVKFGDFGMEWWLVLWKGGPDGMLVND